MCLLAALDSQSIVVKCTAAIFFRTVDSTRWNINKGVPVSGLSIMDSRSSTKIV